MDDQTKAEYESLSLQVRADLKKWEADWADSHNGKKPSRNDIKQNPDIAQKYKQYSKLRDIVSGKIPPPSIARLAPTTPSHRSKTFQTPRKSEAKTPGTVSRTPATNRKLFSPALPTSIGPTPQKDGRVLGLFDLIGKTPSKPTETLPSGLTPRKRRASEVGGLTTPSAKRFHPAATPTSKSQTELFGSETTPLHERPDNNLRKTPSSNRSINFKFSTPAFLRRTILPPVDEQDENGEWKVGPLRLPRKLLPGKGPRGLSQIVTNLRTIQDEAFEDEEEALRGMEGGENGPAPPVTSKPNPTAAASSDPIEVNDSQLGPPELPRQPKEKPVLLSAFDDETLYDSDDSSQQQQLGRDGLPLRIFKKRGQKRTTRKVNMKPTRTKRPATTTAEPGSESEDDEVIAETQHQNAPPPEEDLLRSGSKFEGEESDFDELSMGPKKKKEKKEATKEAKKSKEKEKNESEGVIKKTVRMVKATAHVNYKRLKLRNNGAKGGPGHNSRFRRRR
ncbi:putative DNA replication regulator sld-2 [Podospora fimiseda]|uniref:DNA replication regulator SLD2 n=1 Tax=Podospora fimiseda TaxID=252190 RepID=A0AAN7BN49_9PEZI|nr:putative DNA replication regulator sld-2 [Podospora fimiseda]